MALPKFHGCKMNQVPIPWDLHAVCTKNNSSHLLRGSVCSVMGLKCLSKKRPREQLCQEEWRTPEALAVDYLSRLRWTRFSAVVSPRQISYTNPSSRSWSNHFVLHGAMTWEERRGATLVILLPVLQFIVTYIWGLVPTALAVRQDFYIIISISLATETCKFMQMSFQNLLTSWQLMEKSLRAFSQN